MAIKINSLKRERCAGVLLPVSSLPSRYGIGTLGREAYRFIRFLKCAGQTCWQVLPVGPTSYGDSPYQSFSAFAGNPYFIDLELLMQENLISWEEAERICWGLEETNVDYERLFRSRFSLLHLACRRSNLEKDADFRQFCREQRAWLEDYALFMALKYYFNQREWLQWPQPIKFREAGAVKYYVNLLKDEILFWKFCQYKFFEQWESLKQYANRNGISIIGDIPIYVAMDSADVWVHPELFQLDRDLCPTGVAGVPPDDFSKTGQLWGNPLYRWEAMERDGFSWWRTRMQMSARLYDRIRIDHFIGIVRYFAIPAGEKTAVNGEYKPGPGKKLTDAINESVGRAKIIAEDLGVVIPAVRRLLRQNRYPGMRVLQFAFDGDASNEHLPCHYEKNLVAYGGTHDNETLVGYFCGTAKPKQVQFAKRYLNVKQKKDLPKAILREAYASVANTVIFQAQDILFLPGWARMNFPSTVGGNWRWRLKKGQLTWETAAMLRNLAVTYGRYEELNGGKRK